MAYDRDERGGWRRDRSGDDRRQGSYARGSRPADYDYDDRDFFHRAGDEIRSWFGDDEAERRRRQDDRLDSAYGGDRDSRSDRYGREDRSRGRDNDPRRPDYAAGGGGFAAGLGFGGPTGYRGDHGRSDERRSDRGNDRHDDGYRGWRERQLAEYDRDYDEYRRENQSRFDQEFGQWREKRSRQRLAVGTVKEHQEVVGSDGEHVGKVDYIRGDRIILAKNDADSGGRHHSIPSSWVDDVGDQVKLNKTADEARNAWRDVRSSDEDESDGPHVLDRSFSGTYSR